jgi:flagellar biosynthesis/type III secretory pathway protein FliH
MDPEIEYLRSSIDALRQRELEAGMKDAHQIGYLTGKAEQFESRLSAMERRLDSPIATLLQNAGPAGGRGAAPRGAMPRPAA